MGVVSKQKNEFMVVFLSGESRLYLADNTLSSIEEGGNEEGRTGAVDCMSNDDEDNNTKIEDRLE